MKITKISTVVKSLPQTSQPSSRQEAGTLLLTHEEYHGSEKVGVCVQRRQKCKINLGIDYTHVLL